MRPEKSLALILSATLTLAWQSPATPQEGSVAPPGIDESITNEKPSFLVAAEVNRKTREFREGDAFSLTVTCEEDAYLYVLYQQADNKIYQVFPNKFQPDNLVKARQAVNVPAETDLFRWSVGKPFGKETVKVIATKEPVDVLSKPEMLKGRFNPVSAQVVKGIEVELGEDKPIRWGETDVTLHTYPNTQTAQERAVRRWGLFIGVSSYVFNELVAPEDRYDLNSRHRDAQKLGDLMKTAGRLDGYKTLTNDGATKKNIEDAITKWLPSVSRPGDLVVVYYSGRSGQVEDQSGDEADHLDEFLAPTDLLSKQIFDALDKQYEADKLPKAERPGFEKMREQIGKLGPNANRILIENTAITDDLLARWMQKLDGRQVVLITDCCHSGGLVDHETPFKGAGSNQFDMFQNEVTRLSSLGQSNHAILCSGYVNEQAAERNAHDLSVMTYCIAENLRSSLGPQKLEECFKFCDVNMPAQFEELNRLRKAEGKPPVSPSHPLLMNHAKEPIFLKP